MTMRITIKNEDTQRSLRVTPIDARPGELIECGYALNPQAQTLLPGQQGDFFAHAGRVVLLEELPL